VNNLLRNDGLIEFGRIGARFSTAPEGAWAERCAPPLPVAGERFVIEPTSNAVFARLPRQTPDMLTLNFAGGADDIPTYSLADLYACAAKDDKDFFKRNFGGKIVLIGTLLDVGDRKITSKDPTRTVPPVIVSCSHDLR